MRVKKLILFVLLFAGMAACTPPATSLPTQDAAQPTGNPVDTDTLEAPTQAATAAPAMMQVTDPQLIKLFMLDANNGWAISEANLLRTTDGGISWLDATPEAASSLGYSVASFFLDANTAWLILPSPDYTTGTLYRTMDGGISWETLPVDFSGGYLSFTDDTNGWLMVSLGVAMSHEAVAIFQTSDSGMTWTQVYTNDPNNQVTGETLPFTGNKTGIVALDAQKAWVTGVQPSSDFVYLYMTGDGGTSWVHQEPGFPPGAAGSMMTTFPPHFFNEQDGVLPTTVYLELAFSTIYVTHDGGETWEPTTPARKVGQISLPTISDFFIWDGGPEFYKSQDGGTTWLTITPNINLQDILAGFQFVDANTGWALSADASGHHALYKTVDGGATWSVLIP